MISNSDYVVLDVFAGEVKWKSLGVGIFFGLTCLLMPLFERTFEQRFEVDPADIDFMGHVSNLVYLRWVQDIAIAHWSAQAPQEAQDSVLWVVLRHEIDYRHAALPEDHIRVCTEVGSAEGLKFERRTEIWREGDDQLLAQARTVWLPIDSQTRRPKRLSPELRALFSALT